MNVKRIEKIGDLPEELADHVRSYVRNWKTAGKLWEKTGGSVQDQASYVKKSDRYAEKASDNMKEIKAYCKKYGYDIEQVKKIASNLVDD